MAELVPLSDADRRDIARQIGAMLPATVFGGAPGAPGPALGASYPVDLLPLGPIRDGRPFRQAIAETGRWHHQIMNTRNSFARSETDMPGPARDAPISRRRSGHAVNALVQSRLAGMITESADWIDSVDTERDEARLLVVPGYNLTCIRLAGTDRDRIVVVERPQRLARLEMRQFYDGDEFMAILRDVPPVSGVPERDR